MMDLLSAAPALLMGQDSFRRKAHGTVACEPRWDKAIRQGARSVGDTRPDRAAWHQGITTCRRSDHASLIALGKQGRRSIELVANSPCFLEASLAPTGFVTKCSRRTHSAPRYF